MHGEDGVLVDLDDLSIVIDDASVFSLGFPHFPERLLVDARVNDKETALVQIVEPTDSVKERISWLRRIRPSLGTPKLVTVLFWPHSVRFLVQSIVWERILDRAFAGIAPEVHAQCDLAKRQLLNLDFSASQNLLAGECFTLWPPREVKDERA